MIKPKKVLEDVSSYEIDYYKNNWRLKLDANENIYGCPASVMSAIKNLSQEDISLYPCYGELIDKIAKKYEVNSNNILISNGCDEALNIIINTYIEKDDEILLRNPSFSMPIIYAKCNGAKIKTIDYKKKFTFDLEHLKENISNETKLIYIATPNNPTGEIIRASIIKNLLEEFRNILFIVDCTYINFSDNCTFQDYIDLTKIYDNIIVVKSFSKDFAIAGLRFGISITNQENIKNLKKIASPYNVNAIALNCASILINDDKTLEEIKELNSKARDLLYNELINAGFHPYESEGNFILCDFKNYSDFYYEKLKKNGVITRKFNKNPQLSSFLRITVPKIGGVKYIAELLSKKDVLIFNLDGVIFDNSNSSIESIIKTFEHFTNQKISKEEVLETKNIGNMDCDWNCILYLLNKHGYNDINHNDIIDEFQKIYFNFDNKEGLINNQKLLISKDTFEELSQNYDLVISSNRLENEVKYILEKFKLENYFYSIFAKDDNINKNYIEQNQKDIFEIIEHCPHKTIKLLGDNVDDIIKGNKANIETIGVISPNNDYNSMVNNFRHLGAKYILGDVRNIKNFLKEYEKENV